MVDRQHMMDDRLERVDRRNHELALRTILVSAEAALHSTKEDPKAQREVADLTLLLPTRYRRDLGSARTTADHEYLRHRVEAATARLFAILAMSA